MRIEIDSDFLKALISKRINVVTRGKILKKNKQNKYKNKKASNFTNVNCRPQSRFDQLYFMVLLIYV